MKYRRHNFKMIGVISTLLIVVVFGLTYAAFSGSLNINGTGIVRKSNWDIHFEGGASDGTLTPTNTLSNSTKVIKNPKIIGASISDYQVSFTSPGDSISYSFEIVNDGDYDAKITDLNVPTPVCKVNGNENDPSAQKVCSKLKYYFHYIPLQSDTVKIGDTLKSKQKRWVRVTLYYESFDDATDLPTSDVEISNLGISITYSQEASALVNNDGSTPYKFTTGNIYNIAGEDYYVISGNGDLDYVTLIKKTNLTGDEINLYGDAGTPNSHVNTNFKVYGGELGYAYQNGMTFYSSSDCRLVDSDEVTTGCTNNYDQSDVKYVVDHWAQAKFQNDELMSDVNGYQTRLINLNDLESLGYGEKNTMDIPWTSEVPVWFFNIDSFWTMIPSDFDYVFVMMGRQGGHVDDFSYMKVRPVINVKKSVLE